MFTRIASHTALIAATSLLVLSGCSSSEKKPEPTTMGSLQRSFQLIDKSDNRPYGTVEMDPVGGGRVLDASGRLIGNIVPPGSRY